MESLSIILYLAAGCFSTMWVEKLLVDQGLGNELGLALMFGGRIQHIVLWPIFVGEYLFDLFLAFVQELIKPVETEDDQQ